MGRIVIEHSSTVFTVSKLVRNTLPVSPLGLCFITRLFHLTRTSGHSPGDFTWKTSHFSVFLYYSNDFKFPSLHNMRKGSTLFSHVKMTLRIASKVTEFTRVLRAGEHQLQSLLRKNLKMTLAQGIVSRALRSHTRRFAASSTGTRKVIPANTCENASALKIPGKQVLNVVGRTKTPWMAFHFSS
jgi:hypothetical protein